VFIYVIPNCLRISRSEMSLEFSLSQIHLVPHLEWITMHRLSSLTIGIFVFAGRIIMESYCLQLGKYLSFSKWLDCPSFHENLKLSFTTKGLILFNRQVHSICGWVLSSTTISLFNVPHFNQFHNVRNVVRW
jgi:hypothetical protein